MYIMYESPLRMYLQPDTKFFIFIIACKKYFSTMVVTFENSIFVIIFHNVHINLLFLLFQSKKPRS